MKKYQLNKQHIESINQIFDYTLKSAGINGVNAVADLIQVINKNPNEQTITIELDDNQLKNINAMIDITLKSQGLNALGLSMQLIELLSKPIQ